MLVIPGVELTQNVDRCAPPPPPGMQCLLHVNALFVTPPRDGKLTWAAPAAGPRRLQIYRRALATTRALGGIAQLNHPNFHYAADAALVTTLAGEGLALLEIANRSWDSNDVPAERGRPSTEAIWDQALTAGANVFGTATDDAHHYFDAAAAGARGEPVFPGDLGFVMVRAAKQPAAIRDALARGDFYASTGVLLARVARAAGAARGKTRHRGRRALPGPARLHVHRRGRAGARPQSGTQRQLSPGRRAWRLRPRGRGGSAWSPRLGATGSRPAVTVERPTHGLTCHVSVTSNTTFWLSFILVWAGVGWHSHAPEAG